MDCTVHVSASGISQVSINTDEKHATNLTFIATQLVRKKGYDDSATRGPVFRYTGRPKSNDYAVKVNGTAVK